jgi:hypothetical protein
LGGVIHLDGSDANVEEVGSDVEEVVRWDHELCKTKTFLTGFLILSGRRFDSPNLEEQQKILFNFIEWAVAFESGVGVWRKGGSGENGVWQRWRRVIRVGTQQSISDPLRWTMTRRRGQREGECNNQIEVEYVRGERSVDDTTRGGGGRRKASGRRTTR